MPSLDSYFIPERVSQVDPVFMRFEIDRASKQDMDKILSMCQDSKRKPFLDNPHNSIILYITGLTDQFDFDRERCDTKGGSPPDIDLDFDEEGRTKVLEWIVSMFGRDNVANIGTFGTFGLKSLTRRYFSITEPLNESSRIAHYRLQNSILEMIPEPLFGVECTFKELIEGNSEKDWPPHPELKSSPIYGGWFEFVSTLENMIANQSVHASGVVISHFPITDHVPIYKSGDYERITQFDMGNVEALGLIKFDFLVINNLSILKECVSLIHQRHDLLYDLYNIEDGDEAAYRLFAEGKLTGIFQFETSDTIKRAAVKGKPKNIEDLSDISSLVRPGPAKAGFLDRYLDNQPDPNIHDSIKELWSATRKVLIYQEQLIKLFTQVAKMSPEEGEAARRAVGKKDSKYLEKLKPRFFEGCLAYGMTEAQVEYLWMLIFGCSDYLFNKSHAVAYSYVSYLCAFFKANYPVEFFCALMSVRAATMQPKLWATKAPEYVFEAEELGIAIRPPSILHSSIGFTISGNDIYFGLNGIRSCGATGAKLIISARRNTPFTDIFDFLFRVNTSKINTGTMQALIKAGAFDCMGYRRSELLEKVQALYDYKVDLGLYYDRLAEIDEREFIRKELEEKISRRDELKKASKGRNARILTEEEEAFLAETDGLRRIVALKPRELPTAPQINKHPKLTLTLEELMEQKQYIGCFLGKHPAQLVAPNVCRIKDIKENRLETIAGIIIDSNEIITRTKKQKMYKLLVSDGTGMATVIFFPKTVEALSHTLTYEVDNILLISGEVKKTTPEFEIIANYARLYKRGQS